MNKNRHQQSRFTLTLLRHAKSSWKDTSIADIDRPLNKRGRQAADIMAQHLIAAGVSFHTIFASPSRRTRETIARMLLQIPARDTRVVFDQKFYTFKRSDLIAAMKCFDDATQDIMVVGHNPAMQEAIEWLTGSRLDSFPTAACAKLTLSISGWGELQKGCAALEWVLTPAVVGRDGFEPSTNSLKANCSTD